MDTELLREFYADQSRSFEEQLVQKLANINLQPRRSFARPEGSVRMDNVHAFTCVESIGKKMTGKEIRHTPPTEKLIYEVGTLGSWMELVGGGHQVVTLCGGTTLGIGVSSRR